MTPIQFFNQAQNQKALPQASQLQSSFQFGVEADKLANLVIKGIKTATTSLYDLYVKDGDELPGKQAYDVILDSRDEPVAIIQNDDVKVVDYLAVDAAHAFAEGEGNRTLAYWRQVHDEFFTQECLSEGMTFNPTTARVVLETFHVVYIQ